MAKVSYHEIARAQLSRNCAYVVSESSEGGYTIAKCVNMLDESTGLVQEIFLKGASKLSDIEALKKMENMFKTAIEYAEKNKN